jgi:hypothetical protein
MRDVLPDAFGPEDLAAAAHKDQRAADRET